MQGSEGRGRGRGGRGRGGPSGRGRGGRRGGRGGRVGGQGRGRGGRSSEGSRGGDRTADAAKSNQQRPASQQAARKAKPLPDPSAKLQNGEKGADVHTVSETDRIRWTKELIELRESHWGSDEAPPKVEFPPTLTNTERKFIHQLAGQLGLSSKSSGKGENRRIAIYPKKNNSKKTAEDLDDLSSIPILQVGNKGINLLRQHFSRYPPSHPEKLESKETGSSLVEAMKSTDDDKKNEAGQDTAVAEALNRMGLLKSEKNTQKVFHKVKPIDLERRRRNHEAFQKQKQSNARAYQDMIAMRSQLPAFKHQEEIVKKVAKNQVTIVSGDTGCGKSTQVPQFLLDANSTCNMVVTQPRRIAAISISERVAYEQLQDTTGGQVGFRVRLESSHSDKTQLVFMTPGVLLRQLQSDPFLQEYTHICMDEIHERDQYQEFLLVVLRDLLPQRPDLRLILMSATLQTEKLVDYFMSTGVDSENDNTHSLPPPALVEMEGRMYPVQEFFLEHILDMTGYISVVVDENTGNEEAISVPTMTDDQLEAELARFMNNETIQPQAEQQGGRVHPKLKCVLCKRRDFKDAVELGSHLALCDGGGDSDSDPGMNEDEMGRRKESAPSFGRSTATKQEKQDDANQHIQEMVFEDYDVDAEVELEDFDYDFEAQMKRTDASSSDDDELEVGEDDNGGNNEKWDGQSPFGKAKEENTTEEEEVIVTKKEDAILKEYHSLHDDEQIDHFLLLETMRYIIENSYGDGAILVFLPGWQEISELCVLLESTPPFSNRSKYWLLPMHSGIPSKDQRKVLQRPPTGIRKIVLSTNIAETSLTIDDVSFVVDTGRAKEKSYDPHLKTSTLQPTWISAASAKQRKGRAGRTKRGVCFHLFSQRRFASMRPFVESELLRTPLEEMCLLCKKLGLAPGGAEDKDGVPSFLAKAMSAPHAKSVSNALELLVDLGAMQPETNHLTDLGECLSMLSLEPRVGKMVIWSFLLGCARVAANMAVAMSYKTPFVLPPPHLRKSADTAKVQLSLGCESDQLTVHYLLEKRTSLMKGNSHQHHGSFAEFCRKNFVGPNTIQMIAEVRKNLTRELSMLGFPSPSVTSQQSNQRPGGKGNNLSYHNRHDNDHALWQAAIAGGLYPNVCFRKRGDTNFSTMTNQKVKVHVSSVNAIRGQPLNSKCDIPKGLLEFVCFGEMVKGTAQFFTVNQTTHLASPLPLLLLCGTSLSVRPVREAEAEEGTDSNDNRSPKGQNGKPGNKAAILTLDNWIVFQCDVGVAADIVVLRKRLESAFWNAIKRSGSQNAGGKNILAKLTPVEKDAVEILGPVLQSAHTQSATAKSIGPGVRQ